MFKFLICFENKLIIDSQEKYGDEGVYSSDDLAWAMGDDEIFMLLNDPSSDDFDPTEIVEDDRYRVIVEEID